MKADYINNWHRIWSNRTLIESSDSDVLQRLISVDGFDSPLGVMDESDWKNYIEKFSVQCGIVEGDSIFEVGCGAGAFLYPFYQSGVNVGGLDYSSELVAIAQSVMPEKNSSIISMEASLCPVEPHADVVISNHVIHYFPSLDYSSIVVKTMLKKASRVVAITGVPDILLKQESEIQRRGLLSEDEYEEKYKGLDILYYKKDWFSELAYEHGYTVRFFPHKMPGFAQNKFRFDCIMNKNK